MQVERVAAARFNIVDKVTIATSEIEEGSLQLKFFTKITRQNMPDFFSGFQLSESGFVVLVGLGHS